MPGSFLTDVIVNPSVFHYSYFRDIFTSFVVLSKCVYERAQNAPATYNKIRERAEESLERKVEKFAQKGVRIDNVAYRRGHFFQKHYFSNFDKSKFSRKKGL